MYELSDSIEVKTVCQKKREKRASREPKEPVDSLRDELPIHSFSQGIEWVGVREE